MPIRNVKIEYFFYPLPILLIILSLIFTVSFHLYNPRIEFLPTNMKANDIIIGALMVGLVPIAYFQWNSYNRKRKIQRIIPKFLDTLAENLRGGLNFTNALKKATESYGTEVSSSLRDAINKHYLGLEFSEAIKLASKKINQADAEPFLNVISRAYYAGENAVDAIKNASSFYWSLEEYRNTRESETRVYIGVIFISLLVYLFVVVLILTQLILPITTFKPKTAAAFSLNINFFGNISATFLSSVFLWMGILESLFSGLIIGKIIYNNLGAGLIYSIIMMVITLITFNIFS
jgi:Bacterial type II secretion system protein F domain.